MQWKSVPFDILTIMFAKFSRSAMHVVSRCALYLSPRVPLINVDIRKSL